MTAPRARRYGGCHDYEPGSGLFAYNGFCLNCGSPASQHRPTPPLPLPAHPPASRLGAVQSASLALLDQLDGLAAVAAVRRSILELAWTLDTDDQRAKLAHLLDTIAETFAEL